MIEQIILGIIQGIAEWLPVSSEGLIILAKTNLFHSDEPFEQMVRLALGLHFGTFLAALVYFRNDVKQLLTTLIRYKTQPAEQQKLIVFLILSTAISGSLGLLLIQSLGDLMAHAGNQSKWITFAIGCLLLGTAYLELRAKRGGYRQTKDLTLADGILLGLVQGCAALPGLSRSGLTVSTLLLRKIDKATSIKLSFLMSLPIVFFGNLILNWNALRGEANHLVSILFAFLFGLATIHLLLMVAEKINFGYFVLLFGVLTILSAMV